MTKYHYVECGLPNVFLVNGFEIVEESPYGKGTVIHDVAGLHVCIAKILLDKPDSLTGAEFRFLRRELDLSQRILGELFDNDERTIRTWEREEIPIPKLADHVIRHMYAETIDPNNTFEGLMKRLRELDIEWHERLNLVSNDDWREAEEVAA